MIKQIYLAGGCFWGVEAYFIKLKGVVNTKVGYADGNIINPTYNDLIKKVATHSETVLVEYDNTVIDLNFILKYFFRIIDPFSLNKQGNDVGIQYRTAIYAIDNDDLAITISFAKNYFGNQIKDVKTEFKILTNFYDAERYHQKYLLKNPNGYCHVNLFDIEKGDLK